LSRQQSVRFDRRALPFSVHGVFGQNVTCALTAAATVTCDAKPIAQFPQGTRTLANFRADLVVGYRATETHIHGADSLIELDLNINENDCQ